MKTILTAIMGLLLASSLSSKAAPFQYCAQQSATTIPTCTKFHESGPRIKLPPDKVINDEIKDMYVTVTPFVTGDDSRKTINDRKGNSFRVIDPANGEIITFAEALAKLPPMKIALSSRSTNQIFRLKGFFKKAKDPLTGEFETAVDVKQLNSVLKISDIEIDRLLEGKYKITLPLLRKSHLEPNQYPNWFEATDSEKKIEACVDLKISEDPSDIPENMKNLTYSDGQTYQPDLSTRVYALAGNIVNWETVSKPMEVNFNGKIININPFQKSGMGPLDPRFRMMRMAHMHGSDYLLFSTFWNNTKMEGGGMGFPGSIFHPASLILENRLDFEKTVFRFGHHSSLVFDMSLKKGCN